MREILDTFLTSYVDSQTLLAHLHDYQNPRDCIARMVKKGELIRLKNGFYLIASRFRRGEKDHPFEQIANLLYGPSYVSLEWALSFYHMIPERVTVVTSVTTGSNKEFETPIGSFTYRHLSLPRYSVGIGRKELVGKVGGFLLATPEKALADWVFFTCQGMNEETLLRDLLESKRIEKGNLLGLNKESMADIAEQYRSEIIKTLRDVITTL